MYIFNMFVLHNQKQIAYLFEENLQYHKTEKSSQICTIIKPYFGLSSRLGWRRSYFIVEHEKCDRNTLYLLLQILYRLKEKFQLSLRQDKEKNQEIHLSPIALQPAQSESKTANSLVQPEKVPKVLNVVVDPEGQYTPEIKATTSVCPSPFKMKPIGLQER